MTDHTELDAAITALNLDSYTAQFVAQSASRNAGEKNPSLNWKLTLKKGAQSLTVDYMQGIAHVPGYPQPSFGRMTTDDRRKVDAFNKTAETGKHPRKGSTLMMDTVRAPLLRDVLHSLVMDADVLESSGFEDWASNYGYDIDSRKAESIYRQCIEQGLKLRALIGADSLSTLRDAFQNY